MLRLGGAGTGGRRRGEGSIGHQLVKVQAVIRVVSGRACSSVFCVPKYTLTSTSFRCSTPTVQVVVARRLLARPHGLAQRVARGEVVEVRRVVEADHVNGVGVVGVGFIDFDFGVSIRWLRDWRW